MSYRGGLSVAGLVFAGLSLLLSLLMLGVCTPTPPPPPSGSPYTGGYAAAADLMFRLLLLVAFGGIDLIFVVLAVVFGAIGAARFQAPWQRVSFWVCLPFVLFGFLGAVAVGVWGLTVAAQHR